MIWDRHCVVMHDHTQVPVSHRALWQRIDRQLRATGARRLRRARGLGRDSLGDLYLVDLAGSVVVERHLDLEELGRQLGVLQPFERLIRADASEAA
jgi:hypothetical protein